MKSAHQFRKSIAEIPQLARGRVWCVTCGNTHAVKAVRCLEQGWPKCCGQTMTIDSPSERKQLAMRKAGAAA